MLSEEKINPGKRILILTLSVGSGHVRASAVIGDALADGPDGFHVRTVDAMELAEPWFPWIYVKPYWWMLRYRRELWRALYEWRQQKRHKATAPRWIFRRGCERVLRELQEYRPHLVIVTEIGAAEIASLAKREGWFSAPVLAVLTDFQAEPPWTQPEIDYYSVATEEARGQLMDWGVSPQRILRSGIPIDPSFALPFDRVGVRKALGLRTADPVVLLMAGGMGMAPLDRIATLLERCGLPLQVVAVAGHDRTLYERLRRLRGRIALDLHSFAWTDRIPELMAAADLIVTKPGGLTVSEALASGLPMILTHPIPGPEERNIRYLVEQRVAVHARELEEIPAAVGRLLAQREKRREMSHRARELARPGAAHAVAQVGRAMLEKGTYIDLLAPPPIRPAESAFLM